MLELGEPHVDVLLAVELWRWSDQVCQCALLVAVDVVEVHDPSLLVLSWDNEAVYGKNKGQEETCAADGADCRRSERVERSAVCERSEPIEEEHDVAAKTVERGAVVLRSERRPKSGRIESVSAKPRRGPSVTERKKREKQEEEESHVCHDEKEGLKQIQCVVKSVWERRSGKERKEEVVARS